MLKMLIVSLFSVFLLSATPASQAYAAASIGRIVHSYGPAWIQRGGTREKAKKGTIVLRNDSIITGTRGRVKIIMGDGSKVYIGAKSRVSLRKYSLRGTKLLSASINMLWGKARFFVNKLTTRNSSFRVRTANAVLGVRGTEFVVIVPPTPELLGDSFGEYTLESLPAMPTRTVLIEGAVDVSAAGAADGEFVKLTPGNTADVGAEGKVELRPTESGDIAPEEKFSTEDKQKDFAKKRLETLPIERPNKVESPQKGAEGNEDDDSAGENTTESPTIEPPTVDITDTNNAIQNLSNTTEIIINPSFVGK